MMRLAWLLILVIITIFSGCKNSSPNESPSVFTDACDILQTIPGDDYRTLDSFFQLLLRDYNFAYTLFGEKPMSMACYFSHVTLGSLYHPSEFLLFENGWATWIDHFPSFPSDEFVLKQSKDSRGVFEILLISKKNVSHVISDNLDTFQATLGDRFDPEYLLHQLCYSQHDLMEILNDSSRLLGILLGYGKINSMAFERKVNICANLNARMTPPFTAHHDMKTLQPISKHLVGLYDNGTFSYASMPCFPSEKHVSLADELNDILLHEEVFELYGSDFFLDRMIAPVFMTQKADLETKKLHEEYSATKQCLHKAYLQKPFLEVTLNQWMHPQ